MNGLQEAMSMTPVQSWVDVHVHVQARIQRVAQRARAPHRRSLLPPCTETLVYNRIRACNDAYEADVVKLMSTTSD